jgi:hypothetical protein
MVAPSTDIARRKGPGLTEGPLGIRRETPLPTFEQARDAGGAMLTIQTSSEGRKRKKGFAVDFINRIRTMDAAVLNALIRREAGEELAQFFLSYSARLISRDPERVLENTSSLMLMGYLIRAAEEDQDRPRAAQA